MSGCAERAEKMAASAVPVSTESEVQYEPPTLDEMGDVVELTRGSSYDDTADSKVSKYW